MLVASGAGGRSLQGLISVEPLESSAPQRRCCSQPANPHQREVRKREVGDPRRLGQQCAAPGGPGKRGWAGLAEATRPPISFRLGIPERGAGESCPPPPSLRRGISPTAASSLIPPSIRDSPSAPSCFLQIKTPPTSGLQRDGSWQAPAPDTLTVQQQAPRAVEGCFFF